MINRSALFQIEHQKILIDAVEKMFIEEKFYEIARRCSVSWQLEPKSRFVFTIEKMTPLGETVKITFEQTFLYCDPATKAEEDKKFAGKWYGWVYFNGMKKSELSKMIELIAKNIHRLVDEYCSSNQF